MVSVISLKHLARCLFTDDRFVSYKLIFEINNVSYPVFLDLRPNGSEKYMFLLVCAFVCKLRLFKNKVTPFFLKIDDPL